MTNDIISRQAVLNLLVRCSVPENGGRLLYQGIKQLPSAERHGRWENDGHTLACSNCHTINIRGVAWDYCPNCWAKMDGDTE